MNIDEFVFSILQTLERFEKWWRTLPEAEIEMGQGDWDDQFQLWMQSERVREESE
jgi:hypothetical protein